MKYCLKWTNINKRLIDEVSIRYIEDRGLVDFMEKYADKRIILRLESTDFSDSEIAKLLAIRRQFPNYRFTMGLPQLDLSLINKLKESEIPFYLLQPVQNWELFSYLVKDLGVSDIDLSGALAFELPKVKRFLERNGLKVYIRITPNFPRSLEESCHPLQKFFVRPEDLELYEPYVDVVEFEGIDKQDLFYDIYAIKKQFIGNLNQVIYNLPISVDNVGLISLFGEKRIGCERECLRGGRCKRCFSLTNIATSISPIIREKVKENIMKQIEEKSNEN